jgi:hypothetical protein
MTRTYAVLEISKRSFAEIQDKLRKAGYQDQFHRDDKYAVVIDMHGIAVAPGKPANFGTEEMAIWAKSIYGAESQKGLVEMDVAGAEITVTPTEARAFAYSILEAAEAAETDNFIMDWFKDQGGVPDLETRMYILRDFRERREKYRKES